MSSGARQVVAVVAVALAGLALAVGLAVLTSRLSTQRIGLAGQPEGEGRGLVARPPTTETAPAQTTTTTNTTTRSRSRTTTAPATAAPPAALPTTTSTGSSGSDDSRGTGGASRYDSDD